MSANEGILKPEELAAAEAKHGITLREASDIVKRMCEEENTSTDSFNPMEREAILFLGACWKSGIITRELFYELVGKREPH